MAEIIEQRDPSSSPSNITAGKSVGRVDVGDVQKPVVETPATPWLVKQITRPLPNLPAPRTPTTEKK